MIDVDEDKHLRGATLLDWIKGLGLPIASLFVSGAIFVMQSQQQAFERQLSNIEDGYRFYFEHRTNLERHVDADQEETLLKLISGTFPNVFCNVRADLHSRVAAAEASDAPNGFGDDDREILLSMITSRDAPERMPLSATATIPFLNNASAQPPKCPPLDGPEKSTQAAQASPGNASETVVVPVPAQPAAAPAVPAADEAEKSAAAPAEASKDTAPKASVAAPLASAVQQAGAKVRSMSRVLDERMFRVFFHIRDTNVRGTDVADPLRAPLATNSYRVMRGVERVSNMPSRAEVRYFGPDEESRAAELASMLNEQFEAEGTTFTTVAVGDRYPNMPRTTLEVWLPDPVGALAQPKRAAEQAVVKQLAPEILRKLSPADKSKVLSTR